MSDQKPYASPLELHAETGISVSAWAKWRHEGVGPEFIKFGRKVLYRREAVEKWLLSRTRQKTSLAGA